MNSTTAIVCQVTKLTTVSPGPWHESAKKVGDQAALRSDLFVVVT
jgi:hypothetical protein